MAILADDWGPVEPAGTGGELRAREAVVGGVTLRVVWSDGDS